MPEAAPPASPVLQRITTAYDPEQDRMRLDGERADGSTLTLWLTQRLLKHLLPALWQWLERHDAHCEAMPERDGQPTGWDVRLPDTLTCRLLSGRGQRIHAYLADGSSLRCRAGSLTLVPNGCEVAMARLRKKRADAIDWNSAALILGNHYLWVNSP